MSSADTTRFNQSVAKCFAILEAFSERPGVLTLNELSEISGLDRHSSQRMLHTLVALGYLERGPGQRGYVPGKKILDRTFDYLRSHPLFERALPVLIELQRETGERVDLSLFDGTTVVFAIRRQTKRPSFNATAIGRRSPTFCSAGGWAMLSHLPADEVDDILERSERVAYTPTTITALADIHQKINEARDAGYVVGVGQRVTGEIVLGSAIVDREGRPIGAIHISGVVAEWTPESFAQRFGSLAVSAARALSGKSGYA